MRKDMARRLATSMMEFKCPKCKRIGEIPVGTVLHVCGCGHPTEVKKWVEENGL